MYQENGKYTEDDRIDLEIDTDIESFDICTFNSGEEVKDFIANNRKKIQENIDTKIIQDRAETIAIRKEVKKLIYG